MTKARATSVRVVRFVSVVSMMALVILSSSAFAKNGRDFAGFYKLGDASQHADTYTVTLTARVFNYSGVDVTNAQVVLRDSIQSQKNYGAFSGVTIADRGSIVLKGQTSIPLREYEGWRARGPLMEIEFTDASGRQMRQRVELIARPVGY
jgi:hypothetical protein